jgi:CheY-like chemotaxis protein
MSADLAFLIYPDAELADRLSKALHSAGLKVLSMKSEDEAEQIISTFKYVLPDVLITPLDDPDSHDSILIKLLNANPLMEQVPVVILASGEQEQRRRALRQGLTHLVFPPYEFEEVILTTRLALEQDRNKSPLFGSVSQLSVPDLLQTVEVGRRSGSISLRNRSTRGTIWFRDGTIIEAEIDDGRRGEEAVYAMTIWNEGTFEANFSPVTIPGRLALVPSVMLLEAAKRQDEQIRDAQLATEVEVEEPLEGEPDGRVSAPTPTPLPAAVPAEAPQAAPTQSLPGDAATFHMALALLNIAASCSLQTLAPRLLHRRLEVARQQLEQRFPELRIFQVTTEGLVAIAFDVTVVLQPRMVVSATSEWLLEFLKSIDRTMPQLSVIRRFAEVTQPLHPEMKRQGFIGSLGLERLLGDKP